MVNAKFKEMIKELETAKKYQVRSYDVELAKDVYFLTVKSVIDSIIAKGKDKKVLLSMIRGSKDNLVNQVKNDHLVGLVEDEGTKW